VVTTKSNATGCGVAFEVSVLRSLRQALAVALVCASFGGVPAWATTDGTWTGPGAEWTTGTNWNSSPAVPNNTATFINNGAPTTVTISGSTSINTIQFNAGAPGYSFSIAAPATVNISGGGGSGIVNDSTNAPSFSNAGGMQFFTLSSAANATIINNNNLQFFNFSTAGTAAITNNSVLGFNNAATAGNATITNNDDLSFNNSAGSATITNNFSLKFNNFATAGNAVITNNGTTLFMSNSTAGNSSIITNNGALTQFQDTSTGGQARFITNAGGVFDLSSLISSGMTVGSIEGAGLYSLTFHTLTAGGNDLSTEVSGVIAGTSGSLTKVGTGTLVLSGTNTYTGLTTISAGTLQVDGSILASSGVTVNSAGTLSGTGTVGPATINSGGTLAPGNSSAPTGTLTVNGNLAFQSAAIYLITTNGATASRTAVIGGAAALSGANVGVASGSTIAVGTKYTILTATGGVVGTFNPVVNFGIYSGMLTYDADDVFLTFKFIPLTPLLPPDAPTNVLNVARSIDGVTGGFGALPVGLQNLFSFTPPQLLNALTQLSGEAATGAQAGGFELMTSFLALLTGPTGSLGGGGIPALPFGPERADAFPSDVSLAYASVLKAPPQAFVPHWNSWGAAFAGSNTTGGDPSGLGSHDLASNTGGLASGLDYHASPDTIFGFALAGGGTSWSLSAGLGGGRSDVFLTGVYGTKQSENGYLSAALTYASYFMSTSRTVSIAAPDTLSASYNAQNFGARMEGGYRVGSWATLSVVPYAAVQAQSFWSPAYSEIGSLGVTDPAALSYAKDGATMARSELGSRFDRNFAQPDGSNVDLFGRVAWAHDWQSDPKLTATFIGLPTASFLVNGAVPSADLALFTAGAQWRWRSGWSFLAKFDGEFAAGSETYVGTGRIRYTW
jgi:autotransporter-associated beta strand protein